MKDQYNILVVDVVNQIVRTAPSAIPPTSKPIIRPTMTGR